MPFTDVMTSPFRSPIFAAGVPGITVSISAGMKGRANCGCALSIESRLRLPGSFMLMRLPSRMMSAR